jgi:hypothetical protein
MDPGRAMKPATLRTLLLQARLALYRFGWSNGIACLLCLAAASAWLWLVPHLHQQLEAERLAIVRAQHALRLASAASAQPPLPVAEQRLEQFYRTLGARRDAEQPVKTMFATAQQAGLALTQAEYKSRFDQNGRLHAYQVLLPVKGSYSVIRQFCEKTLLAIPYASLDEISFKREAIATPTLDAKLRFTLYLADRAPLISTPLVSTAPVSTPLVSTVLVSTLPTAPASPTTRAKPGVTGVADMPSPATAKEAKP